MARVTQMSRTMSTELLLSSMTLTWYAKSSSPLATSRRGVSIVCLTNCMSRCADDVATAAAAAAAAARFVPLDGMSVPGPRIEMTNSTMDKVDAIMSRTAFHPCVLMVTRAFSKFICSCALRGWSCMSLRCVMNHTNGARFLHRTLRGASPSSRLLCVLLLARAFSLGFHSSSS